MRLALTFTFYSSLRPSAPFIDTCTLRLHNNLHKQQANPSKCQFLHLKTLSYCTTHIVHCIGTAKVASPTTNIVIADSKTLLHTV